MNVDSFFGELRLCSHRQRSDLAQDVLGKLQIFTEITVLRALLRSGVQVAGREQEQGSLVSAARVTEKLRPEDLYVDFTLFMALP